MRFGISHAVSPFVKSEFDAPDVFSLRAPVKGCLRNHAAEFVPREMPSVAACDAGIVNQTRGIAPVRESSEKEIIAKSKIIGTPNIKLRITAFSKVIKRLVKF